MPFTFTTAGSDTLTASYSGDVNYQPATSAGSLVDTVTVVGPITLSAGSLPNLAPGQTGSTTITVTPAGGFTGIVDLTCAVSTYMANVNDMPSCTLTPAAPSVTGTAAVTSTLAISTTASTSIALAPEPSPGSLSLSGFTTILAVVFFLGIPSKRRRWMLFAGA